MGSNVDEAVRTSAFAEKQFLEKNFGAAKNYALKAQMLCPELEGISQMVATFGVYVSSERRINGELDFYSILGVDPNVERSKIKKQYKKMAVLLHPDKNKTVGADSAFRLVSEAWTLLSDAAKRSSYDQRRMFFAGHNTGAGSYENCSKVSSSHGRLDTFWTVCTACHVQYEYLRKYVNKRLSCKNCRGVFVAVETGLAPANGSFPYSNYSYLPDSGYGSHGHGMSYMPTTTGYCAPNGALGHHSGHRSEYPSNISFQGCSSGTSVGFADPNGVSNSFVLYQANGESVKTKSYGKDHSVDAAGFVISNGYADQTEAAKSRRGRPTKKQKLETGSLNINGQEKISPDFATESKTANGNGIPHPTSELPSQPETLARRWPAAPAVDGRQLLIKKARSEIIRKLEEMRLASEAEAAERTKHPELKRSASMAITVPDSDFHDFDKDRSEECFKPKQIWAIYDEEDGMPRLYCLIRDIISVKPFKIYISYLSSRTDSEFGSVNWLDSGFTKSCGSFRVFHSDTIEQVNIFSHLLSREKAGRGGCVKIYPRCGDIWAMYRNWSPDWNRSTPAEVRHQYDMVKVLDNYSEENGIWVAPLVKVHGFKTVYKRNPNKDLIGWIPRREMLRFSHQVPSCSLTMEGNKLPEGCWDLDPAATPSEFLQGETKPDDNIHSGRMEKSSKAQEGCLTDHMHSVHFERSSKAQVESLTKSTGLSEEPKPAATLSEFLLGEAKSNEGIHPGQKEKYCKAEKTSMDELSWLSEEKLSKSEINASIPDENFKVIVGALMEEITSLELPQGQDKIPVEHCQGECRITVTSELQFDEATVRD